MIFLSDEEVKSFYHGNQRITGENGDLEQIPVLVSTSKSLRVNTSFLIPFIRIRAELDTLSA